MPVLSLVVLFCAKLRSVGPLQAMLGEWCRLDSSMVLPGTRGAGCAPVVQGKEETRGVRDPTRGLAHTRQVGLQPHFQKNQTKPLCSPGCEPPLRMLTGASATVRTDGETDGRTSGRALHSGGLASSPDLQGPLSTERNEPQGLCSEGRYPPTMQCSRPRAPSSSVPMRIGPRSFHSPAAFQMTGPEMDDPALSRFRRDEEDCSWVGFPSSVQCLRTRVRLHYCYKDADVQLSGICMDTLHS